MNHDNRKNWNKNFEYQIVHKIWLVFFVRTYLMTILFGWFLSFSLLVCVFFLYVFFFVCLCVYALSLRFFPIRTFVKSSWAHDFCLSVCLSLSCFFISLSVYSFGGFLSVSLCLFVYLYYVFCLSMCLFVFSLTVHFLSEYSSWRIFVCSSFCLLISLSVSLSLCLFI